MAQANHPPKEAVRAHMQQRAAARTPPPSPEQIRRELGWGLVPQHRK